MRNPVGISGVQAGEDVNDLPQIHVHPAGPHPTILAANDILDHPTLLPGFSVRVAEFFEIAR